MASDRPRLNFAWPCHELITLQHIMRQLVSAPASHPSALAPIHQEIRSRGCRAGANLRDSIARMPCGC
jgi:hypothetical protein